MHICRIRLRQILVACESGNPAKCAARGHRHPVDSRRERVAGAAPAASTNIAADGKYLVRFGEEHTPGRLVHVIRRNRPGAAARTHSSTISIVDVFTHRQRSAVLVLAHTLMKSTLVLTHAAPRQSTEYELPRHLPSIGTTPVSAGAER